MSTGERTVLGRMSPFAMLIFSSLGVVVVGLVFQLLGLLVSTMIFDVSTFELMDFEGSADKNVIHAVKLLQIIGALGTFVFSSLLLSFLYTGRWLGFFPFGKEPGGRSVILLIVIMLFSLPLVNFLTELNMRLEIPFSGIENYFRQMDEQTEKLMMTMVRADNIGALLVNLFMIAIIPAVGEELVFRGLIQRHLADLFRNPHVAIVLASVIFSLMHFQVYSFLPRFFLGMLLGYAFHYGRSIWYPMIAHLVNNALGVVFYYFYSRGEAGDSLEEIGTFEMMPATALFSFVAVTLLMVAWIRMVAAESSRRAVI